MKKITKLMVTFFATLMLLCVISAVLPEAAGVQTVEAATIKINRTSLSLLKGQTYRLKITGTTKKVTWTSSNPQVASVGSKGKVTANSTGTARIVAKVADRRYTCTVTVSLFSVSSTNVTVNKTGSVTVTSKNNGSVKYHVDNPDIVSCKWASQWVGNTLRLSITGKSIGSTKITISNAKNNRTLVIRVRVTQGANPGRTVLMDYLKKHGSTNSNGDKFIRSILKNSSYTYTYGITYSASKDTFSFITTYESGGNRRTLEMKIPNKAITSASPAYNTLLADKTGFSATATIRTDTYTKNTNANFVITKKVGSKPISTEEARKTANSFLRNSMSGWNVLLKEKVRITMKDMGFLAYA